MADYLVWICSGIVVLLVAVIALVRRYVRGGVCHCDRRLDGKTVIITGANTGIGKETARVLAGRGARVIMACRDIDAAARAAEEIRASLGGMAQLVFMQMDLADMQSVRSFADAVLENERRLDILINNAGVMRCPKSRTMQGYEMQYGVNHLGHFLLTNLLLELLRRSGTEDDPSRIINLSSIGHKRAKLDFGDINLEKQPDSQYNPRTTYCNSKLMNMLFTRELAVRIRATEDCPIVTSCLHPGVIHTDLGRHMLKGYSKIFLLLVAKPFCRIVLKTPLEGAQTTLHLALKSNPQDDMARYFADCKEAPCTTASQDKTDAARLWIISEEACRKFLTDTFTLNPR